MIEALVLALIAVLVLLSILLIFRFKRKDKGVPDDDHIDPDLLEILNEIQDPK